MPDPPSVTYDSLENETGTPVEIQRAEIGLKLAFGLLWLLGGVLLLIALFAWLSYPDAADYAGQRGVADSLDNARQTWFSQIKDLLQLLVVTLLIPLLTTLIGYIFGRESAVGGAGNR